MHVDVLLFGPLAEAAGADCVAVDVPDQEATAGKVLTALHEASPVLRSSLGACHLAVNHAFAHDSTPICASDEVAIIGLVSGG